MSLPPNMNSAIINLLLIPAKDPTLQSTQYPIALLNIDLLQSPYQKFRKKVTHSRYILIRQVLSKADTQIIKCGKVNVIYYCSIKNFETTVVSLDTEKAFGLVNWKFLLAVLHKIGFGVFLINWIKTLYIFPNTCLRTNDLTPQGLNLKREPDTATCFPFCFLLFLLSHQQQNSDKRQVIKTENTDFKIRLYADNVLLFLWNT